jgi:hypothetical protein
MPSVRLNNAIEQLLLVGSDTWSVDPATGLCKTVLVPSEEHTVTKAARPLLKPETNAALYTSLRHTMAAGSMAVLAALDSQYLNLGSKLSIMRSILCDTLLTSSCRLVTVTCSTRTSTEEVPAAVAG